MEKSNDFDIQHNQIDLSKAREFIQNIPNLDVKNVEMLTEIGI